MTAWSTFNRMLYVGIKEKDTLFGKEQLLFTHTIVQFSHTYFHINIELNKFPWFLKNRFGFAQCSISELIEFTIIGNLPR